MRKPYRNAQQVFDEAQAIAREDISLMPGIPRAADGHLDENSREYVLAFYTIADGAIFDWREEDRTGPATERSLRAALKMLDKEKKAILRRLR